MTPLKICLLIFKKSLFYKSSFFCQIKISKINCAVDLDNWDYPPCPPALAMPHIMCPSTIITFSPSCSKYMIISKMSYPPTKTPIPKHPTSSTSIIMLSRISVSPPIMWMIHMKIPMIKIPYIIFMTQSPPKYITLI